MTGRSLERFQIEKVELVISDLNRSIHFYTRILGLHLLEKKEKKAFLGTTEGSTLVILNEDKEAVRPANRNTGIYHFAILLPERKYLASFLKHMLEIRYPLVGASDHDFSEAIYLQDPDDIGIEVYADRPRDRWSYVQGQIQAPTLPLDAEGLMQSYESAWEGFPNGTIIGHLHFHVSSTNKARQFYVDKLGLDAMIEMGDQVLFVSGEGYHHHIGLNTWKGQGADVPMKKVIGLTKAYIQVSESDLSYFKANNIVDEEQHEVVDPFQIIYKVSVIA